MIMRAFWDLDTERPLADGVIGRIPKSAAMRYAEDEFDMREPHLRGMFWRSITALDGVYRQWMLDEYRRASGRMKKQAKREQRGHQEETIGHD